MNPIKIRRMLLLGVCLVMLAGLVSCSPEDYLEYLFTEDSEKVDKRFDQSLDGDCKPLQYPGIGSEQFTFLWTSDIHIAKDQPDYMDRLGEYADEVLAAFVLHSGDCADHGLEEEFEKWLRLIDKHFSAPLYTAIGNHDLYNSGWKHYKDMIGPSVFQFEYGTGDAHSHFIFIDTANATLGRDQFDWLEKTLRNSHAKHKFVFSHFPVYDSELTTPTLISDPEERYLLLALFAKYDVDFFLSGHKHSGEKYKVEGVWTVIGGAGSAYKQILYEPPHFYRFDIDGKNIDYKMIYFDDL